MFGFISMGNQKILRTPRSLSMMARLGRKQETPTNPVVLVTGASRGIGKAIALRLGEAGCKVIVNYASSETASAEVCQEIAVRGREKGGVGIPMKCNIGNVDEIKLMFEKINSEVGPLDVLINNAGIILLQNTLLICSITFIYTFMRRYHQGYVDNDDETNRFHGCYRFESKWSFLLLTSSFRWLYDGPKAWTYN